MVCLALCGHQKDSEEYEPCPSLGAEESLVCFLQDEAVILGPPGKAQGAASRLGSGHARK